MAPSFNNMTLAVGWALNTTSLTHIISTCLPAAIQANQSYAVQKYISARIQCFGTYRIRDYSEGSDDLFVCLVWFTSLSQQLWFGGDGQFT